MGENGAVKSEQWLPFKMTEKVKDKNHQLDRLIYHAAMDEGYLESMLLMIAGAMNLRAAGRAGDAAKGKETFEQCAVCHNVDSPEKKMGPSLQGLFKRKSLQSGKAMTDANVLNQINVGGNGMPAYQDMLSADEKANLLAYLHIALYCIARYILLLLVSVHIGTSIFQAVCVHHGALKSI